jgi:hypothetical protein
MMPVTIDNKSQQHGCKKPARGAEITEPEKLPHHSVLFHGDFSAITHNN